MRIFILLTLLLILVLGFFKHSNAYANASTSLFSESIKVFKVTQQDLDSDSKPDVTVIDCAFATEYDRVLVYDQNGDMLSGSQWQKVTDFIDDVWVFDVGADGTAQLIVDFNMEDGRYVAPVYDDINGDGQVSYRVDENHILIEESKFWHIKVESNLIWGHLDSLIDPNLTFLIDGVTGIQPGINRVLGNDGEVDLQIEFGDNDKDGIIDYQLRRAISPLLIQDNNSGFFKTTILSQVKDHRPIPYPNTVFWPLLIGKHYYEDYRYFDHQPTIAVDWQAGVIDKFGILGFPIEAGYHIYSRLPSEKGITNEADFEDPMVYYDMADDQDGWPELQVRFDVAVPHDPYFPFQFQYKGKVGTPNLEVDYSWDQDNDNRWDYKIALTSNSSIDEVINFPDFAIKSIPYDHIIPWVKNHTWDMAMLVFDSHPSLDSEGMYGKGWMIQRGYADGNSIHPSGARSQYMMGFSDQPPVENYQDIQEFMRGEYSFRYFDTPKVYLSALDRQLHLYNAQSGVWNLGGGHYIRYANLDGDAYLDQWQVQRDGTVVQQVNYSQGFYLYDGTKGVLLKQSYKNPVLFETQPPGSFGEWQRLDGQVQANKAVFSPDDFSAMIAQLSGPEMLIQGAVLRDYRLIPQGFRFVLALEPGFTFTGPDWLGLDGRPPGDYLAEYSHSFTLKPLTPARIMLDLQPAGINRPKIFEQIPIKVNLANLGLEDKRNSHVLVEAQNGGETSQVISRTVDLLSQTPLRLEATWQPDRDGEWLLVARVEDQSGMEFVETRSSILIHKGDLGSPETIVGLSSYGYRLPILALLLVSAFFSAVIFTSAWTKLYR